MSTAAATGHHPSTCENCGTWLQGGYCHLCGQSAHNPTRHFGHAVEEIFESFWHLDGRVFRTLRDLFVPGRIANRYLAGHRVRYVAPMRLFVILTLLTFFVAKFVVQDAMLGFDPGGMVQTTDTTRDLEQAQTVADVVSIRDAALADIAERHGVSRVRTTVMKELILLDVADDQVDILLDEGWDPGHVALLTTGRRHPVQIERQDELGQRGYWDTFWDNEDVFYGHVLGAKGMERRAVVLCINESGHTDRFRERLYVGLSRATDRLVVVGDLEVIARAGEQVARALEGSG